MKRNLAVVAAIIMAGLASSGLACSAQATPAQTPQSPAPAVQPSQPAISQPASSVSAGQTTTAGQLADQGKSVYAQMCARCHGDSGQGKVGPLLIGPSSTLSAYGTGQGLFNFVSTVMPADAPGSLSKADYLRVVAYLLVQNNFVSPQSSLDQSTLSSVNLK